MKQGESTRKVLDISVLILSLGVVMFLASYALLIWESPSRLVLIFVPLILVLWTARKMRDGRLFWLTGKWCYFLGLLLAVFLTYSAYYFYTQYHALLFERAANNDSLDMFLGFVLLCLVFIVTWLETGPPIPIVMLFFVAYAFLGNYLPPDSFFYHAGLKFSTFMGFSVLSPGGIFGSLPIDGFTLVVIFLIFAGVVRGCGSLSFIINFSVRITRRFSWGLPQIPVIASLFFGSFSGAAAANVAGTGSFTIPMMKRFGVHPKFAAAIEAVASSGGQIVPPIMGVAAFLMADFLGIPYLRVIIIGIAPALVFYLSVAFAVYLITQGLPISNLSREERENLEGDFRISDGIPLAVAILVLLFYLIYYRSSVLVAGMWMLISYLVMQFFCYLFRFKFSPFFLIQYLKDVAGGIESAGDSVVEIMAMLATMGVIAKMLEITGLSQNLSFAMVDFAGGRLFVLLPLIFVVCILMGMAVSTVVVYIMVALLAAPALVQCGVAPDVANFTVFYFALLSAITPPVAIAVAVACGIAKSKFLPTALESIKVGLALFILPFLFLIKPEILSGNLTTTPLAFLEVLIGMLAITYSIFSKRKGRIGVTMRSLFAGLGLANVFSPVSWISWSCVTSIFVLSFFQRKLLGTKRTLKELEAT